MPGFRRSLLCLRHRDNRGRLSLPPNAVLCRGRGSKTDRRLLATDHFREGAGTTSIETSFPSSMFPPPMTSSDESAGHSMR